MSGGSARASHDRLRLVEIVTYRLVPGTREVFHAIVEQRSVPLLQSWGIDVVAYGCSAGDDHGYFLVRAYHGLSQLEDSQSAFYGSAAWRNGPREEVLRRIESMTALRLWLDQPAVDALRGAGTGRER